MVGKKASGVHVYLQVTAGSYSAVSARKLKLEAVPWHVSDIVELLQLVQTEDPANARRTMWWFRVHRYEPLHSGRREWALDKQAVEIPPEWFKRRKGRGNGYFKRLFLWNKNPRDLPGI